MGLGPDPLKSSMVSDREAVVLSVSHFRTKKLVYFLTCASKAFF